MLIKRVLQIAGILAGWLAAREWGAGWADARGAWMGGAPAGSGFESALTAALGAIIGLLAATVVAGPVAARLTQGINRLTSLPAPDLLAGAAGAMLGLAAAALAYPFLSDIPRFGELLAALLALILVHSGVRIAWRKKDELAELLARGGASADEEAEAPRPGEHKILDTSVIIDGRIADICKTGFIE